MIKKKHDPQVQVAYKFPFSLIRRIKDEAHREDTYPARIASRRIRHSYKVCPNHLPPEDNAA